MLILVILLALALIFGVGAVLEGLAWLLLIALAFIIVAAVAAYRMFRRAAG